MIRTIIASILPDIQALNFADLVAGIITPISRKIFDTDNNAITKIFPAYDNTPSQCLSGDYVLCIPDEKYKSIIYFEEINTNILKQDNLSISFESQVRLIGWFNLKKINNTVNSDTLMRLILQVIPETVADFGDIYDIRIELNGIENKNPSLFAGYTYDEAETQYLIFPYDYGAMNFIINFTINKCLDPITIIDNCGKK